MILRYHNIGNGDSDLWVSENSFINQMETIKKCNYDVVSLESYDPYNDKQVVIIFDDGRKNILKAMPYLRKYGFPFYVFVVGELLGCSDEFLDRGDFAIIREAGGELGWYTKSHPDLTTLPFWKLKGELVNPYGFSWLSYPHYKNTNRCWASLKQLGYKGAISGNGHADTKGGNFSLDAITVTEHTDMRFVNDKIVKYIDMALFSFPCNLRCRYCYVGQYASPKERAAIWECKYSPEDLKYALDKRRMGGTCIVTFSSTGETLLTKGAISYIKSILDAGHFLHISTNLTIRKHINELLNLPLEMRSRIFFKASLQFEELKRHRLLKSFAKNCRSIWDANATCAVEIVPHDELIPLIPEIKSWCLDNLGALPQLSMPRDETVPEIKLLSRYSLDEFSRIWEEFESEEFRFKVHMWERPIKHFCYAGMISCFVILNTGEMLTCPKSKVIGNFFEGKNLFTEAAAKCPQDHCFVCHNWLGFGSCPSIDETNYLLQRDRVMPDGRHWVSERCRNAFRQRVCDNNILYSAEKEKILYKKAEKYFKQRSN